MANGIFNHLLSLFCLIVDVKTLSNVGVCIADERCFWEGQDDWTCPARFWRKVRMRKSSECCHIHYLRLGLEMLAHREHSG